MKVRAIIIGASGYSGEELLRLLLRHPSVEISYVTSRQNQGKTLAEVFPKFAKHPTASSLKFTAPTPAEVLQHFSKDLASSIAFLALPHGVAAEWAKPFVEAGLRVIDLSADFRIQSAAIYKDFYGHDHSAPELLGKAVYGLPEVHRAAITKSKFIASPGCYPTSILLPLIPLLKNKIIKKEGIIADSLSGVSGAGRKAEESFLFCECNESVRAYGVPKHRHLSEIEEQLSLAAGEKVTIQFTPHLIPINRGILSTLYVRPEEKIIDPAAAISECWKKAYASEPFVKLLGGNTLPDTKNVSGTNFIELASRMDPRTGRLVLFSAEDNLTKGASGQAVQSMNLLFGFDETQGLL